MSTHVFDRFRRLVTRDVVIPPPSHPPDPSPVEQATGTVRDWMQGRSEACKALLLMLDHLRDQAELTENSSLANQPLMLFHHGRVAAFKELKATLLSLSVLSALDRTKE